MDLFFGSNLSNDPNFRNSRRRSAHRPDHGRQRPPDDGGFRPGIPHARLETAPPSGRAATADVRIPALDSLGERTDVDADWATTDPDLIAITRHASGDATIVVRHPGNGRFTVATRYGTVRVQVHARQAGDGIEVDFRQ